MTLPVPQDPTHPRGWEIARARPRTCGHPNGENGAVGTQDDDLLPGELVSLVEELRTENARLRGLLGLDSRANDGHETAWTPTLFAQSSDAPPIDATAGDGEKLRLLWSRFGARSSVYATRWESASSGKAGWSPATRGGWRKKGSSSDYLPLTNGVFLRHLGGELTVGIYPLLPGDTCRLLVCDFDKDGWVLDALPTSTPATTTVSPPHSSSHGRATEPTSGCSSTGRCRQQTPGPWGRRCYAWR